MTHADGQIELSIIIVSHNTREMTQACLDSIQRETTLAHTEVIVVDAASKDGSPQAIADHPLRPQMIALGENAGFARATNIAAAAARGRYLLLLNPDTVVCDRAIERLMAFAAERPDAGIWGGRTMFADGRLNPSSCWRRMTIANLACRAMGLTGLFPRSGLFNGEAYGGWARDDVREVDIVSGCFLLISRRLWDRLGGFDQLFFMYGEDADLCLRARRLGARPVITPAATIVHHGGASERTRAGKLEKLLAAKASLIARHWPRPLCGLGQDLLALWPASRALSYLIAARITGSPRLAEEAATWQAVWAGRASWRGGYRPVTPHHPGGTLNPHLTAPM